MSETLHAPLRIALAILCALALAATHWRAYTLGGASERADFATYRAQVEAAHAQAVTTAAATRSRQSTTVLKATHDRTTRLQSLQADFDSVRTERDRLRDALATATANLPPAPTTPGADTCAPERELLSTMGAGLDRLAGAGAGIAQAADRHAVDVRALGEAWPK